MKTKLKIVHGAGSPHEVAGDIASRYSGTSAEALRSIVREEIHDADLLATLGDSRVALEQDSETEGTTHEAPVAPNSQFADILARLEQTDVEIGVSRSHEGGTFLVA